MAERLEKHPNPSKNKHEGLVLMRGPEPLGAGDLEAAWEEGVERKERKPAPKESRSHTSLKFSCRGETNCPLRNPTGETLVTVPPENGEGSPH